MRGRSVRLALLDPAWIVVATLVGLTAAVLTETSGGPWRFLSSLSVVVPLLWLHGIYQISRERMPADQLANSGEKTWVFLTAAVGLVILTLPGIVLPGSELGRTVGKMLGAPVALAYFASCWLAAAALLTAESKKPNWSDPRLFGVFLLMVYAFAGAWILRSRIQAIASRNPTPDA